MMERKMARQERGPDSRVNQSSTVRQGNLSASKIIVTEEDPSFTDFHKVQQLFSEESLNGSRVIEAHDQTLTALPHRS